MNETPRDKTPVRSVPVDNRPPGTPPPRRDPFPMVIGGVVGALVVGLLLVVYLLVNNGSSAVQPTNRQGDQSTGLPPVAAPVASGVPFAQSTAGTALDQANTTPEPTVEQPPRMPMDEFKALYDDPSKRPLIIDVRAKAAYDEGHIQGAVSVPEDQVDARLKELPKDKLIIAYCQ